MSRRERFATLSDLDLIFIRRALFECFNPETDAEFKRDLDDEIRDRARAQFAPAGDPFIEDKREMCCD